MMLESKLNNLSKNTMKYIPIGLVFGMFFLVPLLYGISVKTIIHTRQLAFTYTNWYDLIDSVTDVWSSFIHIFCAAILVAGLILL
jgi:hypothetical protein